MSLPRRRWLEGFSRRDGSDLVAFSRLDHEWTTAQALDVPVAAVAGADYGINLLGGGAMPKRPARERVRFLVRHDAGGQSVDEQVDGLRARLRRYGLGRLWMVVEGYGAPARRWAWAQVVAMPEMTFGVRDREFVGVPLEFTRLSDWMAEAETVAVLGVGAPSGVLEVVNAGTADARAVVVELASAKAGGYQQPQVVNTTTGESVAVALNAGSASHRLRLDGGRMAVERSTDGGATWASAWGQTTLGPTQTGLLTLVPGSNYIEVSSGGSPDMTMTVRFHAPFE